MKIDFLELSKDEQALILIQYYWLLNDAQQTEGKSYKVKVTDMLFFRQKEVIVILLESEGYPDPQKIKYDAVETDMYVPSSLGEMGRGDISQFLNRFRNNWEELDGFDPYTLSGFGNPIAMAFEKISELERKNLIRVKEAKKKAVIAKFAMSILPGIIVNYGGVDFGLNVQYSIAYAEELFKQLNLDDIADNLE